MVEVDGEVHRSRERLDAHRDDQATAGQRSGADHPGRTRHDQRGRRCVASIVGATGCF
jgi:hypothetical protein